MYDLLTFKMETGLTIVGRATLFQYADYNQK